MAEIYTRGNIWWITYSVHGRRVRKSLKTTKKQVAKREKQAIEAELLSPHRRTDVPKNPSVDVFWEKYFEWAKDHKRPRSIDTGLTSWKHLIQFTGAKRVGDVRRADIEAFKKWRTAEGNTRQTVNNALRDLQAIFNRGIKEGYYTGKNPVEGVERYTIERRDPQFHSEEELNRLLDVAQENSKIVEWTILLGGWAGLRKMELVNARWEWFEFNDERPLIHVQAFPGFTIKDHENRTIPMNRRIYDALYPHRKAEGFLFESGEQSQGRCRYRFDPKKSLDAALQEAGLTTQEPFQRLRRSFGSVLVNKGAPIYKVSKWLGHSSVRVTERHYAGIGSQAYDADIDLF